MSERRIPEEQAQRIWRRAAELQAAAAERAELRKRTALLANPDSNQPEDLALLDVEAAAVEAGIGAEFVQEAIAEMDSVAAVQPAPSGWISRTADRVLGRPPRVIETSRTIAASPETIYGVMQKIFPNPPFSLLLRDTLGTDLFTDGVFVFETDITSAKSTFDWQMEFGDIKRILVTLRPVSDRNDACEVTIRAPLGRLGLNLALSGGFTTASGTGGAIAGAAVAPSLTGLLGLAGGLATVAAVGSAMVTGIAAGGLVLAGYRALYRWGMRQGLAGLETLLQAIVVDVRTRGAFTPRTARELPANQTSRDSSPV
jgi:hypothetical protein